MIRFALLSLVLFPAAARPGMAAIVSEWVIPPGAAKKPEKGVVLGIEPDGSLCLVSGKKLFFYPNQDLLLMAERPIEEFFWLPKGAQLVHAGNSMGFLSLGPAGKDRKRLLLQFQPIVSIPYKDWTMFPGAGDVFFIVGRDPKKNRTEITRWRSPDAAPKRGTLDGRPASLIFATQAGVGAAAGSDEVAYFTVEKTVFRLREGAREPEAVFVHPSRKIRELAFVSDVGLFYATDETVGFIGGRKQFDFLTVHAAQIRAAKGALYVMMGGLPGGVMRITGGFEAARLNSK